MTNPTHTPLDLDALEALRLETLNSSSGDDIQRWFLALSAAAPALISRAREADELRGLLNANEDLHKAAYAEANAAKSYAINETRIAEEALRENATLRAERALLIQSGLDMMAKITTLRAAMAKAVEALEMVRFALCALHPRPQNPEVEGWPCNNPADRECLSEAYAILMDLLPKLRKAIK